METKETEKQQQRQRQYVNNSNRLSQMKPDKGSNAVKYISTHKADHDRVAGKYMKTGHRYGAN